VGELYNKLATDVRLKEGLKACVNCGTCTAICPAASFYNYSPRDIVDIIQTKDDDKITSLLKSDFIWYCGECMSCKTRCPRGNTPGLVITVLRSVSQEMGFFVESEKGRQQLAVKRTVGDWILKHGYCVYAEDVKTDKHPEQGPVWDWENNHLPDVMNRLGANYNGDGPGIYRKIPEESLEEIRRIFDITGGTERFRKIEDYSRQKAGELGLNLDDTLDNEYMNQIYTADSHNHNRNED
jgi:heterodisulfide reductase subunit C1